MKRKGPITIKRTPFPSFLVNFKTFAVFFQNCDLDKSAEQI